MKGWVGHSNISSVGDGQSEASDTAELFARKYRELYVNHITLQKFNKLGIDPSSLLCDANKFWYSVSVSDVEDAVNRLMSSKSDDSVGLSSDYFIHDCDEFHVHVSLLLMLSLYMDLHLMTCVLTLFYQSPKVRKNTMLRTVSGNYREIALSSIFGKVLDLIFLSKFADNLCTSNQQFGFKRNHSTTMCIMVLE